MTTARRRAAEIIEPATAAIPDRIVGDDHLGKSVVSANQIESGSQQLSFTLEVQRPLAPVLLTEGQVCELLGIGRTTLRSLPPRPKHIKRCVRYLASDVERYVAGLT